MDYVDLKILHLTTVILSISGFVARGSLMLADSPLVWNRWIRTFPHIVDTLLLISGGWLAYMISQIPGNSGWLTAKLIALVLYVVLGVYALRRGRTKTIRVAALLAAIATFGYMVLVAITKSPWAGII